MIYVVLGMHKSGTTLVSRMLHASGINMGEGIDETVDYDRGNKYERQSMSAINHLLVKESLFSPLHPLRLATSSLLSRNPTQRKSWHHSLAFVRSLPRHVQPELTERMRDVIEECNRLHDEWGFKDPRTCLAYHLWREHLGRHKVIVVYRGLGALLRHYGVTGLHQANLLLIFRVLHAWKAYGRAIISACVHSQVPTVVVRYERLMEGPLELERLSRFVGRALKDERVGEKYRNRGAGSEVLPLAASWMCRRMHDAPQELLGELEALRAASMGQRLSGSAASG